MLFTLLSDLSPELIDGLSVVCVISVASVILCPLLCWVLSLQWMTSTRSTTDGGLEF